MLDIIRLIFYFFGIKIISKITNKYCNKFYIEEDNGEKYIFLGSLLFSFMSLIWYKTIYINFIYHFYIVLAFIGKKYRIDLLQYQWIIDGLQNSDDENVRYFSNFTVHILEDILT